MEWADNQIKEREIADQELLDEALVKVAEVVLGEKKTLKAIDRRIAANDAISQIMKHYRYKMVEVPESVDDIYEQLEYCLRPHGVMYREVKLKKGWYQDSFGPILAFTKEGSNPVALIPGKFSGYWYTDEGTGVLVRLTALSAEQFAEDALCFYRPLEQKELSILDLMRYVRHLISVGDVVYAILAALAVALVGMLTPRLTAILTGPVLMSGEVRALVGIAVCIICVAGAQQLLNSTASLLTARIENKIKLGLEGPVMMRLLSLPTDFFGTYSAGDLKSRFMSVSNLCTLVFSVLLSGGLTAAASLLYLTQIFAYTPALVFPAMLAVVASLVVSVITLCVSTRVSKRQMELAAAESGVSYSVISGVRKIRLAGAEKRLFAKWLDAYTPLAELTYDPPLFMKVSGVISLAITLVSNIALYYLAVKSGVDQSSYFAFVSAYGMLLGAFTALSDLMKDAARIKPTLEMAEPFLKTVPETSDNKEVVTDIQGDVEFDHVRFRYDADMPYVIDDLSMRVKAGEYVAVVGKSGCGKSTLMRLIIGFEEPDSGTVYIDDKDISRVDLPSLRRKIGTVMQHDGLFQGTIYSNITITAPELSMDEAWEAAEVAGIADDIRALPMGMMTYIGEGSGGISGGQRQRLMIARAVAPKPKLLIFDEATSALDNKTQKQVTDALDAMGCTRIVIAHRLSTIRHCDRILVLDGGKIAEDGTYEELIEKDGLFAELVERQRE